MNQQALLLLGSILLCVAVVTGCGEDQLLPLKRSDDAINPPETEETLDPLDEPDDPDGPDDPEEPLNPGPPPGYALEFDGVNDAVMGVAPELYNQVLDEVTTEAWIFIRGLPNDYPRIVDRSDNFTNDRLLLTVGGGTGHINVNQNVVHTASELPTDEWLHLAATYDGTTVAIYVNGELSSTREVQTVLDLTHSDLVIGNGPALSRRQFDGYIDEVRIWRLARTAEEIQSTMSQALDGDEEGLLGYWPLDEGEGQIVHDLAGNLDAQLGQDPEVDDNDPRWIVANPAGIE